MADGYKPLFTRSRIRLLGGLPGAQKIYNDGLAMMRFFLQLTPGDGALRPWQTDFGKAHVFRVRFSFFRQTYDLTRRQPQASSILHRAARTRDDEWKEAFQAAGTARIGGPWGWDKNLDAVDNGDKSRTACDACLIHLRGELFDPDRPWKEKKDTNKCVKNGDKDMCEHCYNLGMFACEHGSAAHIERCKWLMLDS